MPKPCWLKHLCSIRALVPVSVCLSVFLSFSSSLSLLCFWLIPWNSKASCITQGMSASSLLSLSHCRLRTTRFRSIKGLTHSDHSLFLKCQVTSSPSRKHCLPCSLPYFLWVLLNTHFTAVQNSWILFSFTTSLDLLILTTAPSLPAKANLNLLSLGAKKAGLQRPLKTFKEIQSLILQTCCLESFISSHETHNFRQSVC